MQGSSHETATGQAQGSVEKASPRKAKLKAPNLKTVKNRKIVKVPARKNVYLKPLSLGGAPGSAARACETFAKKISTRGGKNALPKVWAAK